MKFGHRAGVTLALTFGLLVIGCNQNRPPSKNAQAQAKAQTGDTKHSTWWCEEHGVPEHLCSLCMSDAEAKMKYKDKGDWCKIHNRAQSQCFKCDPSKYAKFEEMYELKYGKKPPRPPEEEFQN
jgi:hypothetical protein